MRTTGIVHGDTIRVTEPLGLPDGQSVVLEVHPAPTEKMAQFIQRATEFAATWTTEDDRILEEIARDRESQTFRELPE